jgi:hypothetical protein
MKSRIPLLVACFLVLTAALSFAAGSGGESRTGTLVSFTGTSLTLAYPDAAGNTATASFVIDGKTEVKRLDQAMPWLDVARKGLVVTVEPSGAFAASIQVPFYGLEAQGIGSATAKKNVYALSDIRVNTTDSNLTAASERKDSEGRVMSKVEIFPLPPETDNAWALNNSKEIMIGNIDVIEGSVKLRLGGFWMNVAYGTDGKGAFYEPVGTSCVVDKTKGVTTIKFDAPIGANYDEVAPRLQFSFQKVMLAQKTTEITYLELDPSCVIEVNGAPGTIAEATDLANFWLVRCSTANKLVHIDSYFVDKPAKVIGVYGAILVVDMGKFVALPLAEGLTILTDKGEGTTADLAYGTKVLLTTEPADAYGVVLVSVVK